MKKLTKTGIVCLLVMLLGVLSVATVSATASFDSLVKDNGTYSYMLISDFISSTTDELDVDYIEIVDNDRQVIGNYLTSYNSKTDIIVIDYHGEGTSADIPAKIGSYNVVAVSGLFYDVDGLENVNFPASVKVICDWAASGVELSSITLPEGLVYFGNDNLYNMSFESLNIPASLKFFGAQTDFSVAQITLDSANKYYKIVDNVLYSRSGRLLVKAPTQIPEDYKIASGVTEICGSAFSGTSIERVIVPQNVTKIDSRAFISCPNLTEVYLPEQITLANDFIASNSRIKLYSFGNVSSAKAFTGNAATNPNSMLIYKDLNTDARTYGSFTYYINQDFGAEISRYDGTAAKISIPAVIDIFDVSSLRDGAFYGDSYCKEFTVESTDYFSVDDGILYSADMKKLISYPPSKSGATFEVSDDVCRLGDYAFAANTYLKAIVIPNHISTYRITAFKNCDDNLLITVRPHAVVPATVKTTSKNYNSIVVSWDAVKNVDGYRIYRKTGENGTLAVVNIVEGENSTTYNDTTVTLGETYYYSIEAYKDTGYKTVKTYSGYDKTGVKGESVLAVPKITSVKSTDYNTIVVTWNAVDGADQGYIVYRQDIDGNWTTLKTVASTVLTYTDKTAVCGSTYKYAVRAVRGQTKSNYQTSKAVTAELSIPQIQSAKSGGYNSVKLTWTSVAGASGYYILRRSGSEELKTVGTVSGGSTLSYTDKGLNCGTEYYYAISAYRTQSGKIHTSKYVEFASPVKPVPAAPVITVKSASYNSVTVSWNNVLGANGYRLFRRVSGTTAWTRVATVNSSNISYTDKNLTCGTIYEYKLVAYKTVGSTTVWGAYSSVRSVKVIPATPTGLKAAVSGLNQIKITWTKVAGATGYIIYRKAKGASSWTKIGTLKTNTNSFTDKAAQYETTYYYTVKAYRTENGKTTYSGYNKTGVACTMVF